MLRCAEQDVAVQRVGQLAAAEGCGHRGNSVVGFHQRAVVGVAAHFQRELDADPALVQIPAAQHQADRVKKDVDDVLLDISGNVLILEVDEVFRDDVCQ